MSKKRKYLTGGFRRKIWEKHNKQCQYCFCETTLFRVPVSLLDNKKPCAIDHIVPFSKGGACTEDNFQLLCVTCNSQKGASLCSK